VFLRHFCDGGQRLTVFGYRSRDFSPTTSAPRLDVERIERSVDKKPR